MINEQSTMNKLTALTSSHLKNTIIHPSMRSLRSLTQDEQIICSP
jgi:hypothetical protein